jgi:UDP-glucuronate 4-epimerase
MSASSGDGCILVTGGAGFIGSHLCERLVERGHQVVCLDAFTDFYDPSLKERNIRGLRHSPHFHLVRGEIRDANAVEEIFRTRRVDHVVHLAAKAGVRSSLTDPVGYELTNVQGTLVLLEAARRHGLRSFVFGSSSSVYGSDSPAPFAEDGPIGLPVSPYAVSKRCGEHFCQVYSQLFGLSVLCLRFFTVFGPRNRPDMAAWRFVNAVMQEKPVTLYGDGSAQRDFTYVSDTVAGIEAALGWEGAFDIVNLGNSRAVTVNWFLKTIAEKVGKEARVVREPEQPGEVPLTCADTTKAERVLGFRSRTTVEEGIEHLVAWARTL